MPAQLSNMNDLTSYLDAMEKRGKELNLTGQHA
jgi:hypothetical protein